MPFPLIYTVPITCTTSMILCYHELKIAAYINLIYQKLCLLWHLQPHYVNKHSCSHDKHFKHYLPPKKKGFPIEMAKLCKMLVILVEPFNYMENPDSVVMSGCKSTHMLLHRSLFLHPWTCVRTCAYACMHEKANAWCTSPNITTLQLTKLETETVQNKIPYTGFTWMRSKQARIWHFS